MRTAIALSWPVAEARWQVAAAQAAHARRDVAQQTFLDLLVAKHQVAEW
jgi:hypothetical protein